MRRHRASRPLAFLRGRCRPEGRVRRWRGDPRTLSGDGTIRPFVLLALLLPHAAAAQGVGALVEEFCGQCGLGAAVEQQLGQAPTQEAVVSAMAAAIEYSRNDARALGTLPMPPAIRQALSGFYPAWVLDGVEYRVGVGSAFSVQAGSMRFGDATAVATLDTITFADAWHAENDEVLWAHELKHVEQFRTWGLTEFARRYVQDYEAVEAEAYEAQVAYQEQRRALMTAQPSAAAARACVTPQGSCPMGVEVAAGTECWCPAGEDRAWGVAQ
jgi:hypothetical protein